MWLLLAFTQETGTGLMAKLIPYLGAKRSRGTMLSILGRMPQHEVYFETHLGTGCILNAKPPTIRDVGIELNAETIELFTYREGAEIIHGACLEYLAGLDLASMGRVFIYCDPPYLMATRTSGHRHQYKFDYTLEDHLEFLAFVKALPPNVMVMISGYPSELYDEHLAGWRTHQFQAMTRGGVRTEMLWMNYPVPEPFWHTQAGVNAEDRRRIKRLAKRWGKNFNNRTIMEQIAILASMAATHEENDA